MQQLLLTGPQRELLRRAASNGLNAQPCALERLPEAFGRVFEPGCKVISRQPNGIEFGIVARTIYRLAASGEIPAFKLGGTWRFSRSDIESWIKEQSAGSPERAASKASNKGDRK